MKKVKDEAGSVLILVVLVIGVLSILGTSVLSAALSNYKMKVTNASLKTNLYIAEAGLEETYGKIYNYIVESIDTANTAAKNKIAEYDDELFEQAIVQIANGEPLTTYPYIMLSGSEYVYNNSYIEEQAELAFVNKYKQEFEARIRTFTDSTGTVASGINSSVIIKATELDDSSLADISFDSATNNMSIKLSSKYSDDKSTRKANVILDISIPDYHEPYTITVEGKELSVNPIWKKAIATDGNIIINSPVSIKGDVFSDKSISINGGSSFKIEGDIVATKDIEVNANNIDVALKDIYANNVYLNGTDINFKSSSSDPKYSGVYIKDDFEMNNLRQSVVLNNNYCGFSDGSQSQGNLPDKSSGIIINSDDIETNSSFTLNGNLYLYGTSYITLANGLYQTGESLSVKGNYIAYTMPLALGDFKEDMVEFDYFDPLMLVYKKKSSTDELTVADKNQYFYDYYMQSKDLTDLGGLKLNNVKINTLDPNGIVTLGDYIAYDNLNSKAFVGIGKGIGISTLDSEFKRMEKIYNLKTMTLGDTNIAGVIAGATDDTFPNSFPVINVYEDVDFSVDIDGDGVVANYYSSFPTYDFVYIVDGSSYDVNLESSNSKYLFVISNGVVNITGNGNLNGCIIAKGGVNISGTNANLTYNERIVLKAFADVPQLKAVFKEHENASKQNYTVTSIVGTDPTDDRVVNVDYSSLLNFRNWKIKYD